MTDNTTPQAVTEPQEMCAYCKRVKAIVCYSAHRRNLSAPEPVKVEGLADVLEYKIHTDGVHPTIIEAAREQLARQQANPPAPENTDPVRSQALRWASKSGATTKEDADKIYAVYCELKGINPPAPGEAVQDDVAEALRDFEDTFRGGNGKLYVGHIADELQCLQPRTMATIRSVLKAAATRKGG